MGQWRNSSTFNAPFPNLMGHKIILEGPFFSNRPNFLMIKQMFVKNYVPWFDYNQKNKFKQNKTLYVYPFSVFWPFSKYCLFYNVLDHLCLTLPFQRFRTIFKSMWYKKKHFIGYLCCFNHNCRTVALRKKFC